MPVQVQPTETPSVATDTRPFDDAEFVAKLKDIATNRNYLSRQFIDGFAASRSYHYQAYLNICKLSNQGKDTTAAIYPLKQIALDVGRRNGVELEETVAQDYASVLNAATLSMGCSRTAPN